MKLKDALKQITGMVDPDRMKMNDADRRIYDRNISRMADSLMDAAADSVNCFGIDTVKIVDGIGDGREMSFLKKLALLWIRQWASDEATFAVDGRNEIAVRRCKTLAGTEEFEKAYDAEDEYSEEWRVASICAGSSYRMHKTLMQQFTGVVFQVLSRAGVTQADTSRLPMI